MATCIFSHQRILQKAFSRRVCTRISKETNSPVIFQGVSGSPVPTLDPPMEQCAYAWFATYSRARRTWLKNQASNPTI